MPDGISFTITGAEELNKKLAAISDDMKYKGGRAALRKAAQLVANAAVENVKKHDDPETGRSIASNIIGTTKKGGKSYPGIMWSSRRFKATGDLMFRVGVAQQALLPKKDQKVDYSAGAPTPHWRLLEFGTKNMRAFPFLRPALTNNITAATNEFIKAYTKSTDALLRKMSKGK